MRYLSLIVDDEIVAQIPTTLSDQQAIEIDDLLREQGKLQENEELAITEDIQDT